MGNFLIPANSKKSMLIFGFFTWLDLAIFASGATITMFMLLIFNTTSIYEILLYCVPLFVGLFLVMPLPYYHNIRVLIKNTLEYFFSQRRYIWKGWCVKDVYGRDYEERR